MKTSAARKQPLPVPNLSVSPSQAVWGRLRRELIWTLGERRARSVMMRVGFSCGESEALVNPSTVPIFDEFGTVQQVTSTDLTHKHLFEVTLSGEAAEHLRFFDVSTEPQCWFLTGFLTGLLSHQHSEPIYFVETECIAKKDPVCRFVGRYGASAADLDVSIYDEDNLTEELITTQKQLRLTKDRYQNLFEQSSSAIFIIDPKTGVNLNTNIAATELTGYSAAELARMTIFDLCDPDEHHRLMSDMKSLMGGGRPSDREISILRKDGMLRIIANASKMLIYDGKSVVQSVMRDVTDLKTSERKEKDLQNQLLRSERLSSIGRLSASVAHELKNPLGAIRNAIYYVRNALKDSPILETDPHLKMILKLAEGEVDASVVIIGELLDFSRVVQIVPRHTQINEVLEKLPNIVQIPENVEWKWDLDVTLPSASVDPDRLNQVFCNIINNACQAMAHGGILRIKSGFVVETSGEAGPSQEQIVITIEDTGSGIEPVHLSKIFEPLFTTKARGTGLGLAISRNIVEKHGGVILVTSQVGKGTSFTIKLPLKPPPDKEASL